MKRLSILEIYNLIAIIIIIGLSAWCYNLHKDLKDTEEILQLCEGRYYELLPK
jgi:hypothetical protein